jgi:hypothetical protein
MTTCYAVAWSDFYRLGFSRLGLEAFTDRDCCCPTSRRFESRHFDIG